MAFRGRLSNRRIALFASIAVVLLGLGWLQFVGAAALSGMSFKDMDWNEDGELTRREILQGFVSVSAVRTQNGQRSCVEYRWRRSDEVIRTECRTDASPATP